MHRFSPYNFVGGLVVSSVFLLLLGGRVRAPLFSCYGQHLPSLLVWSGLVFLSGLFLLCISHIEVTLSRLVSSLLVWSGLVFLSPLLFLSPLVLSCLVLSPLLCSLILSFVRVLSGLVPYLIFCLLSSKIYSVGAALPPLGSPLLWSRLLCYLILSFVSSPLLSSRLLSSRLV